MLIRFAMRVLRWLDWGLAEEAAREKYGWLLDFREDLAAWRREQQLVERTVREVRTFGWTQYRLDSLEDIWELASSAEKDLVERLRSLSRQMIARVGQNETLPGSTEVLESAFGQ